MRVTHPEPVVIHIDCPVYACTLSTHDHVEEDERGQIWHYDDTTGVHWPTDSGSTEEKNDD